MGSHMFVKIGFPNVVLTPRAKGVLLGMQWAVFPHHFKLKQDEITLSKITLTFFKFSFSQKITWYSNEQMNKNGSGMVKGLRLSQALDLWPEPEVGMVRVAF